MVNHNFKNFRILEKNKRRLSKTTTGKSIRSLDKLVCFLTDKKKSFSSNLK